MFILNLGLTLFLHSYVDNTIKIVLLHEKTILLLEFHIFLSIFYTVDKLSSITLHY